MRNKINNVLQARVIKTQMMMQVEMPDGTTAFIAGNSPSGSDLEVYASDVFRSGQFAGYEGYRVLTRSAGKATIRRHALEAAADAATSKRLAV